MLKLTSVTFENAPRIPGVRPGDMTTITCENPSTPLVGWRAILRGAALFLVSPKGWKTGKPASEWDPEGPSMIHEIPRIHCFFHWEGEQADIDAAITKGKFESPPFGPPASTLLSASLPSKGILAQLDPSQMGDP